MSSERQSSRSRDWAGSGALLPLLKAFRGHLTSPRHSWLRCGFACGCLPSSPVLGHDRRRSGPLGSPSPHCLSSEALSISPAMVGKTQVSTGRETQVKSSGRRSASVSDLPPACRGAPRRVFAALHTGRLCGSCRDADTFAAVYVYAK